MPRRASPFAGAVRPLILALASLLVLPAGCRWPDQGPPPRGVDDVRVTLPGGAEDPEAEAFVREILARWRALYPRAPLPDVRIEVGGGAEGGGAGRDAGLRGETLRDGELVVRVDPAEMGEAASGAGAGSPPASAPASAMDAVRAAAPRLARGLAVAAQEAAPRPPFLLTLVRGGPTLLERAVEEGAADLLAHLVAGRHPHPELLAWGRSMEGTLWRAFQEVMDENDAPGWFDRALAQEAEGAQGDEEARDVGEPEEIAEPERQDQATVPPPPPGDPARFLGYRIAEAYWNRTSDRLGAVRELVRLPDPVEVSNRSLYAGGGAGLDSPPHLRGVPLATWPGFTCGHFRQGEATLFGCTGGEGPVTVVLEAGAEADHRSWHLVAQELARETRVVIYDRAGTGDSEPGGGVRPPLLGVHEMAALLEVLGGSGPYLLAGSGAEAGHLRSFAVLYPWRTAGIVFLGTEGPARGMPPGRPMPEVPVRSGGPAGAHLTEPGQVVEMLAGIARELAAGGASARPGERGEPRGCWQAGGAGRAELDGRLLRLAHTPSGGEDLLEGSHQVLAVETAPSAQWGRWVPLGTERIQVALGPPDGGGAQWWTGELAPSGGEWRGGGLTLRPHPCELPE